MNEAPILQSPHAVNPAQHRTLEEMKSVYSKKIDDTFKAYTVIDVLTKVYHRNFSNDLQTYIGNYPEEFYQCEEGWKVSRAWVNSLRIMRIESVFSQPVEDFKVELVCETRIKLEIVRQGCARDIRRISLTPTLWLRYKFDFRLCHLLCDFDRVILDEQESLHALHPKDFFLDKYLLPIMSDDAYRWLSYWYLEKCFPKAIKNDVPIDIEEFFSKTGLKYQVAEFKDISTLGEYYFSYGVADIVHPDTGEITTELVMPGRILINKEIISHPAAKGPTLLHELTHYDLGHFFLVLQKTHGHDYCSYLCKRLRDQEDAASPITRMEIQANTLPRYIMIPDYTGRLHAEKLLQSYGGERNLQNIRKLIDDMAQFYGTTKTMAKSRLKDFGYTEVDGIMKYVNGSMVPSYISKLEKNETYIIDEVSAIKEYARNPEFRRLLDSGRFVYVRQSGVFCLNDSAYIIQDQQGELHLTSEARMHMSDCCLVFKEDYAFGFQRFINGVLQRDISNGRGRKTIHYVNKDGSSPVTADGLEMRKKIREEMNQAHQFVKPFGELLIQYMDQRKISVIDLAIEAGLSEETIKKMRNSNHVSFSIQTVVAVAIALHLPPQVSSQFIEASPAKFLDTEEMYVYRYLLQNNYQQSVAHVNRLCVEAGIQPLTTIVEGFDDQGVRLKAI